MKNYFFLLSCIFCHHFATAQTQTGNEMPEKVFAEKIFIHTDKPVYISGETIWFRAVVFNGSLPGSFSTNFYIDLLNSSGEIIQTNKLPIFDGSAYGNFSLPDSLPHDFYFLRAYTKAYIRQGNAVGIIKPIAVLNPENISSTYRRPVLPEYRIEFFPESGHLVEGLMNTIAFKATDQSGRPAKLVGLLLNNNNDTLQLIQDESNGVGMFSYNPEKNNHYRAVVIFNDTLRKEFDLPVAANEGMVLNMAEHQKGKIFQVQRTENFGGEEILLTGYMFNKIVFREKLKFTDNTAQGIIPASSLPPGLLTLSVAGKENKPLAVRTVFIQKPNLDVPLNFRVDTIGRLAKELNVFTIGLPDSLEGSLSVSVTEYNPAFDLMQGSHIGPGILLNEINSNSSFVMSDTNHRGETNIDLALITEKQLPVKEMAEKDSDTADNYITVSGKMSMGPNKPVSEWPVMFVIQTKDSASSFLTEMLNKDGSFLLNNLVFDDSARFYYQYLGKKTNLTDLELNPPQPEPSPEAMPKSVLQNLPLQILVLLDSARRKAVINQKKFVVENNKYKLLEEVKVTVRKKKPIDVLNKKYTGGLFSSMMNVKVYDFINEPPPRLGQNIFDFLQGRVAGLTIDRRGGNYFLSTNRARSLTGGPIPVQLFLNEMPVEAYMVIGLTLDQIALVKYFPAGSNNMMGFGLAGRLAIYTKQPEDYKFNDSHSRAFFYVGYSPSKEFPFKDYSIEDKLKPDFRTTLYWNPEILLSPDQKEFKLRFYNSDNTRKYKITVQGFTTDGRFIDFEKIID